MGSTGGMFDPPRTLVAAPVMLVLRTKRAPSSTPLSTAPTAGSPAKRGSLTADPSPAQTLAPGIRKQKRPQNLKPNVVAPPASGASQGPAAGEQDTSPGPEQKSVMHPGRNRHRIQQYALGCLSSCSTVDSRRTHNRSASQRS